MNDDDDDDDRELFRRNHALNLNEMMKNRLRLETIKIARRQSTTKNNIASIASES